MNLILASASPRRSQILNELGVRFDVLPAQVDELNYTVGDPEELVLHNARIKAEWVAEQRIDELILASDTTVALNYKIFNKPTDLQNAHKMLTELSGQTHKVQTSVFRTLFLICNRKFKSRFIT